MKVEIIKGDGKVHLFIEDKFIGSYAQVQAAMLVLEKEVRMMRK